MSRRGWLLFATMSVVWGVPYLLIKVAVGELSPAMLVFARTGLAALALVPLAAARRELAPLRAHWRALAVYTAVELAAPWLLLSDAERTLTSSLSGLLVATVPLIGAVLGWAVRSDDRPDATRLAGLVVGIAGVAALLGIDLHGGELTAVGEVFLTAVGYAIGPLVVARRLAHLPSIGVIAVSLGATAVGYTPWALTHLPARTPGPGALASVVALAVVCTGLAFVLFFALIAEVGPARATVITYLNPAVAVLLGVTVLGEPFTVGTAVGFPLVLAGCWLSTRRVPAPGARPPRPVRRTAAASVSHTR